jgi:hypothetical protein
LALARTASAAAQRYRKCRKVDFIIWRRCGWDFEMAYGVGVSNQGSVSCLYVKWLPTLRWLYITAYKSCNIP